MVEITAPRGLILAHAADSTVAAPLLADYGVWTPGTQALIETLDRNAAEPGSPFTRKVLWLTGQLSPEMEEAVSAHGWQVEDRVFERHLLAYEYQEQMAIKDALIGQRIFPRIGD